MIKLAKKFVTALVAIVAPSVFASACGDEIPANDVQVSTTKLLNDLSKKGRFKTLELPNEPHQPTCEGRTG